MSVFDSLSPPKATAELGAQRVKRTLAQAFQQVESALRTVHRIADQNGAAEMQAALGNDAQEVERLYQALKGVVEQCRPGFQLPDYPKP
jgi:hypothetical protein